MREEFNAMKAQWENEKNAIGKVQKLREEIGAGQRPDLEKAQREYDLEQGRRASSTARCLELQKQLEAEEAAGRAGASSPSLLRDKVTEEEIARIVERWTGIPVAKLMEGEREKLLHLEDILHQRVIGQDEAVQPRDRGHPPLPRRHRRTPTGPSAPSCSSAPPASARPSWPRLWPRPCLTTRRTWCAST